MRREIMGLWVDEALLSLPGPDVSSPSRGTPNRFTEDQARNVWERYHELPEEKRHDSTEYALGDWGRNRNKNCDPWLAALIRDFLAQHGSSSTGRN